MILKDLLEKINSTATLTKSKDPITKQELYECRILFTKQQLDEIATMRKNLTNNK